MKNEALEINEHSDGTHECKGSLQAAQDYLSQNKELGDEYEVEMFLKKIPEKQRVAEALQLAEEESDKFSYKAVNINDTLTNIERFNKFASFNPLTKRVKRGFIENERVQGHLDDDSRLLAMAQPRNAYSRNQNYASESFQLLKNTSSPLENVKGLPSAHQQPGVRHYVNKEGYYYIYLNIESFPSDAIMVRSDNVTLDFDSCHIKPNSFTEKDHRDAIQIIPNGGGHLHYAGARISDVSIYGADIRSSDKRHKLQGITGFDGVYINIELEDIDIETPLETRHEITFNGLLSGTFNNVYTNNGYILLAPIRLCGGRNNNETIWLIEPFKGDNGEDIYLYKNVNSVNSGEILDGRRAFRTMSNGQLHHATNIFKYYSYREGNKIYSGLNLDALWEHMRQYRNGDLDTVIRAVTSYVDRHAQRIIV